MKGNKSRDTQCEVRLRSALHRLGYRFRKNYRIKVADCSCRADIVFTARRVAVFVDGCFWHGCPEHGRRPRANPEYWGPKLAHNVERDLAQSQALERGGWAVVRIWEHVALEDAVSTVISRLISDDYRQS
jgi:DNA mismatch endonuclease (patch repair protein)